RSRGSVFYESHLSRGNGGQLFPGAQHYPQFRQLERRKKGGGEVAVAGRPRGSRVGMTPDDKIDPEVLQARWVLGGIRADELPDQAALALEQGYDGTALRQLAGLVRPTLRDLEALPEKAFADMGRQPMDKDQAVEVLIARGMAPANALTS